MPIVLALWAAVCDAAVAFVSRSRRHSRWRMWMTSAWKIVRQIWHCSLVAVRPLLELASSCSCATIAAAAAVVVTMTTVAVAVVDDSFYSLKICYPGRDFLCHQSSDDYGRIV